MTANNTDYSMAELLAVFISRQIQDGEVIGGGGGNPITLAGQLLAHVHHGPNMRFYGMVITNLWGQRLNLSSFLSFTDPHYYRNAEGYWVTGEVYEDMKLFLKRVFFIGGIQIDMYGNTNLFGLGNNPKKFDLRGPGGFGTATAATHVGRYFLFSNRHDRRTFVPRCDFITAAGWGDGSPNFRTSLGLPGKGPVGCITPLCFMDFDDDTRRMRLGSLHPGISADEVMSNTGFELVIPRHVERTDPPSTEELKMLRGSVDPEGILKGLKLG